MIFLTDRFCKQLNVLDLTECKELTEQSKFYAKEKLTGKLKVSESETAAAMDQSAQPKPSGKNSRTFSNPERLIVATKAKSSTSTASGGSTSKFLTEDLEFFEEADDGLRERIAAGDFFIHHPIHAERRNRFRILRIREALRRNAEFMQHLQRIGAQQFRRLWRPEFQDGQPHQNEEHIEVEDDEDDNEDEVIAFGNGMVVAGNNDRVAVRQPDPDIIIEEDDGGPAPAPGAAADGGPNRLPEIHMAEIYRLGLRPEDVDFWLQNRALFQRGDERDILEARDIAELRARPEREVYGHIMFRRMELEAVNPIQPGDDEEFLDMEVAIRRVVMNAFDGDEELERNFEG